MNIETTYDDARIMTRINAYDDDYDVIELFDVDGNDEIDDALASARIAALANDDVVRYIETFLAS